MCIAVALLLASALVQADQYSSGDSCKSHNEHQKEVSLLQMQRQRIAVEEGVENVAGDQNDNAPEAEAMTNAEPKVKPRNEVRKHIGTTTATTTTTTTTTTTATTTTTTTTTTFTTTTTTTSTSTTTTTSTLDKKSQWISCSFDWNTLSHAHVASSQWGYIIPGLTKRLEEQRNHIGKDFKPISTLSQSHVPAILLPALLQAAASMLDEIRVNWYLAFGSEIGYLRSEAFIPWDEDVDIVVKNSDRIKACDFIKQGGTTETASPDKVSVFRAVPGHPEWLMVGYYSNPDTCHKVVWVDVETEVAIDMCIDCGDAVSGSDEHVPTQRALFGNVEVNVPQHPFNSSIQNEHGVDKVKEEITMKTLGSGWNCDWYKCNVEPLAGTSAVSLKDAYSTNLSAMQGPFDFHIDTSSSSHTTAQCSLPRNFLSCSTEKLDHHQDKVFVTPCQSSPFASATLPHFTASDSAYSQAKQVAGYEVGTWMVVQLQTQ